MSLLDVVLVDGYERIAAGGVALLREQRPLPPRGAGFLAGDYPGGITTVEGVPASATVRALYRPVGGAPGDGVVVAEVQSGQDGVWRVDGLHPAYKFDVVGRRDGFNDVILSNVSPSVG